MKKKFLVGILTLSLVLSPLATCGIKANGIDDITDEVTARRGGFWNGFDDRFDNIFDDDLDDDLNDEETDDKESDEDLNEDDKDDSSDDKENDKDSDTDKETDEDADDEDADEDADEDDVDDEDADDEDADDEDDDEECVCDENGHDFEIVEEKEATCTTDGNIEYKICKECGYICDVDNEEEEYSLSDVTIKATGHEWSKWKVTKKATFTECGEKTRTCSVCGKEQVHSQGTGRRGRQPADPHLRQAGG